MSRNENNSPVAMTYDRRTQITQELRDALEKIAAPFEGEQIILTCVRHDGAISELICEIVCIHGKTLIRKGWFPRSDAPADLPRDLDGDVP